jgi:transposase
VAATAVASGLPAVADITGARHLLAASPAPGCFIADKAYDADDVRAFLAQQGAKVVISLMRTRTRKPDFDPVAYRVRNVIERAFCKLKDWRAFATRYDKPARNFFSATCLAVAVTFWIK